MLNTYDRNIKTGFGAAIPMRLSTSSIISLVEIYGEGLDTFEKILFIESKMFPSIVREFKPKDSDGTRNPNKH